MYGELLACRPTMKAWCGWLGFCLYEKLYIFSFPLVGISLVLTNKKVSPYRYNTVVYSMGAFRKEVNNTYM